jgi:hypothetical protein
LPLLPLFGPGRRSSSAMRVACEMTKACHSVFRATGTPTSLAAVALGATAERSDGSGGEPNGDDMESLVHVQSPGSAGLSVCPGSHYVIPYL